MATLVELRCEIATRMHQGESFSSIEDDVIATSDMSDDQKSALWLYGWAFVALRDQRRGAHAHIARLSEHRGVGEATTSHVAEASVDARRAQDARARANGRRTQPARTARPCRRPLGRDRDRRQRRRRTRPNSPRTPTGR